MAAVGRKASGRRRGGVSQTRLSKEGGNAFSFGKAGKGARKSVRVTSPAAVGEVKARTSLAPATVREGLGVKQPEFARMTGYSVRSVAGWEAGQPVSQSARQKVTEMDRLRESLAGVMAVEHIGDWLTSPNDAFAGQAPLQVIERGEIDRIWRMIFQLEAGVAT